MISIVVKRTIRPDRSDEWLALTDDFTQATRNEEGNLFFEWSHSVDIHISSCWWRHSDPARRRRCTSTPSTSAPRWRGCLTWSQGIRRSSTSRCRGMARAG